MESNDRYRLKDVIGNNYAKRSSVRFKTTIAALGKIERPCLDIGERNALGELLNVDAWTNWDLNKVWPNNEKYKSITCFEVLEHLQRPKVLLTNIEKHLSSKGKLYLTTPCKWWMGEGKHHYSEYNQKELVNMIISSGFVDVKITRIRAYNLWHFGIRPLIRWLRDLTLGQCFFVEATKNTEAREMAEKDIPGAI